MTLNEKNILLHSYILTVHNMPCTTKMAEGGLGWVCKTTEGLGDVSPLAGSRGGALVGGLGDEVPQKLKNFKSRGHMNIRGPQLFYSFFSYAG